MPETSQTDQMTCPLLAEAHQLCRLAYETPRDAKLLARIARWRATSPQHEDSWRQAQRQWALSGGVKQQGVMSTKARMWYLLDLQWERLRGTVAARPAYAMVPVLALLMSIGLPWLRQRPDPGTSEAGTAEQVIVTATTEYQSAWGERTSHLLEDGSSITLNWDSAVTISMDATQRHVVLQRGEALFEVVADAARPFVVTSGTVQTRAVGTAFRVRLDSDITRVAVTEGIVEVANSRQPPVTVQVNEEVSAGPGFISPVSSVDAVSATAWREGMLIFDSRPLQEVLEELGRYTTANLVIDDIDNAEAQVTATYFVERADDALLLLCEAFDLALRRDNRGRIHVEGLPPNSAR